MNKNIPDQKKELYANYIYLLSGIIVFVVISILVSKNITNNFDCAFLLSLRNPVNKFVPIGPSWVVNFFRDVTSLGSVTIVIIISVITVGYLIIAGKKQLVYFFLFTVISGGFSDLILKELFARLRPTIVPHLVFVNTFSFPSGHATMSFVLYFSLALILINSHIRKSLKTYTKNITIFLIFIIGFSRIYLGVHYPTDVLAGWALGMIWISIGWILVKTKSKLYHEITRDE